MLRMRRYVPILIAGSALLAAACRDSVAPPTAATETTLSYVGDQSFAALTAASDPNERSATFTLSASGGVQQLGGFTLKYAPNSVCDPETSGYGFGTWTTPCTSLTRDIEITAQWGVDANGKEYVAFSPDIRFNPAQDVTISIVRPEIVGKQLNLSMYLKYNIWYVVRIDQTSYFIDEAFFYPELRTHFDTQTGNVWRKIHHFSDYFIRGGNCDPSIDPNCAPL